MTLEETLKKLNKDKKEQDKTSVLGNSLILNTKTSTGSPYLDFLTGGGFANGGYNHIIASGGVGKSSISLLACKDTIVRRGKIAVYFDAEGTLNESYFKRMGVDKHNFIHVKGRNLEEMLDKAELFAQTDEVGIIVFDSIPIFIATAVQEKSAIENSIGNAAKRYTERMPIIEGYATNRDICLLGLTSYKLNPGAMGSDPRTIPRGEWQKTMVNVSLDLTKKDMIKDSKKKIIGHTIDVRVKKTKDGQYDPKEKFNVNFYNEGGFNAINEYAELFCEFDFIKVGGAGWITFPDKNGEEKKVQGTDKFADYLKENLEDFEFLKQQL